MFQTLKHIVSESQHPGQWSQKCRTCDCTNRGKSIRPRSKDEAKDQKGTDSIPCTSGFATDPRPGVVVPHSLRVQKFMNYSSASVTNASTASTQSQQ